MGYALQPTIRVPLPAEYGPGLWIAIKNPKMMSWGDKKAIARAQQAATAATDNLDTVDVLAGQIVVDWNLPPLDGSAPIAPLPAQDSAALSQVPEIVATLITDTWVNAQQEDSDDPNSSSGSGNGSEADPSPVI